MKTLDALSRQVGEGNLNPGFEKHDRFEPEISVNLLLSMELKLRMVKKDYVFKRFDGVDIEATVHRNAPRTETQSSDGTGVSNSC